LTKLRLLVRTKQEQRGPMRTPKRRSASAHIGRLRSLTLSARTLAEIAALRAQGAFRHPSDGNRPFGRTGPADGLIRWLAERTRRADQSPFAKRTRQAVPVCPGEPAQAHRHDLGKTNPRYQTRRRDEPDCADQARQSRHAGPRYHGQTNRRGRPVAGWAEMSDWAEPTQSRGIGEACTFSLSAQSTYSPFG
jgi:hypothetical protein